MSSVTEPKRAADVAKMQADQAASDARRAETEAKVAEADLRFRSGPIHYFIGLEENLGIGDQVRTSAARTQTLTENLAVQSKAATPAAVSTTYQGIKKESESVQTEIQKSRERIAELKQEKESERQRIQQNIALYSQDRYRFDTSANLQLQGAYKEMDALESKYGKQIQQQERNVSALQGISQKLSKAQQSATANIVSQKPLYANPNYAQKGSPEYLGTAPKNLNQPEWTERPKAQEGGTTKLFAKSAYVQHPLLSDMEKGKETTHYTLSLTESGPSGPKDYAVSLSEGRPPTPKNYTQEQVNKLSPQEYAVYASEFGPYNAYIQQQEKEAKKEYDTKLFSYITGIEAEGTKFVNIITPTGDKVVPIESAFYEIRSTKDVTGITPLMNVPEGYMLGGRLESYPENLVLIQEEKQTYGPSPAYQGENKNPRIGQDDYLQSMMRKASEFSQDITKNPLERVYAGMAQTGGAVLVGAAGLLKGVKGYADIITGNVTEAAPVQAPLAQEVTVSKTQPSQVIGAISGGGSFDTAQKNAGLLRQSLDQIVEADFKSRRTESIPKQENPFSFALKEQKPQTVLEKYLDIREGVTTGITRGGAELITMVTSIPEAAYESKSTGDINAGTKTLERHLVELDKTLPPGVFNTVQSGGGTGRSPYYNVAAGFGEALPATVLTLMGLKGPKAPEFQKPQSKLSPITKARLLTKSQAMKEGNIYGVEKVTDVRTGLNVISQKIENIRAALKKPKQFLGSIGTEESREGFNPLTKEAAGKPSVSEAIPERVGVGPKGEKITIKSPKAEVIPKKGKPSETPAIIISTEEKGLTGIVRSQPHETITNQIGVILRGDIAPATAKKLGLKQISAASEDKPPLYAARLPKGAKKREQFLSMFEEAEKKGAIKRVTDIDFIPTETALEIQAGKMGGKPLKRIKIASGVSTKPETNVFYHGTPEASAKQILKKGFDLKTKRRFPSSKENAVYLTPEIETAESYAGFIPAGSTESIESILKKRAILKVTLKPGTKIFNLRNESEFQKVFGSKEIEHEAAVKKLKERGYSGMTGTGTIGHEVELFDKTAIEKIERYKSEKPKVKYEKSKGRKDVTLGLRGKTYGPKEIRAQFKTAPYYEAKQLVGSARELRIKGEEKPMSVSKAFEQEKIPKGKLGYEEEFGSASYDKYLREVGLEAKLEPKAAGKTGRPFAADFEDKIGTGGSAGKAKAITQKEALDIAASIKPLTQGVKEPSKAATIIPSYGAVTAGVTSGYSFETEVTGKYTRYPPMELSEHKLDIYSDVSPKIKSDLGIDMGQKDLLGNRTRQVQPQVTQEKIRIDSITKAGIKEQQKQRNVLAEKLIMKEETRQVPREITRLEEGQKLREELTTKQKLITPLKPEIPEELKLKTVRFPPITIPRLKERRTKREKEEAKDTAPFIGNVFEEQVTGGFKEFDVKYGQKKVSRQSALGLAISRKGKKSFVESKNESFLGTKQYYFTEKKPKPVAKSGFAKPGKRFRF